MTRGPYSPQLFLFVVVGLTSLLKKGKSEGAIGHAVCRGTPPISNLLFANNSVFFYKASMDQAQYVK